MSKDLLQRLMAAQTDEERSWIVMENLLESLPEDLARALWSAAIPHWFDAAILVALCPELADKAEELYGDLQKLSCVEVFADRGHNVHELTRNQLLDRLWQDDRERFRDLSGKAAAYFENSNKPESQIERIYHLVIAEPENENRELFNLAQLWSNNYRKAEVESLILNLQQQIAANRVTVAVKAETSYWDGRIKFRFYQVKEALERYEAALAFYREIGNRLGEANTLRAIGDVLQFLDRRTEALERYEAALAFYREIGDRLGEANTLKAIGDVLQFLKRSTEALERYEAALAFYREIGDRLGEANTLIEIGDVLRFLDRRTEALERYEAALAFYREIGDRLGEANTLKAIGNVLQFLKQSTEALERYEAALAFYREIGARLGEANTLKAIGDVLQFLDRRTEALERYEAALAFYREIGARLGEANVLLEFGKLLDDPQASLNAYAESQAIYQQIGDRFSQGRTLFQYISDAYLALNDKNKAIEALQEAAAIGEEIDYSIMTEYANNKIRSIQESQDP
jgi:tetratricopeptide (TPR) repeat protein